MKQKDYAPLSSVLSSADAILAARQTLDLPHDRHPLALYLALLDVESAGQDTGVETDCCRGPYQISKGYMEDAISYASRKGILPVALAGEITIDDLRLDVFRSAMLVMLYQERYSAFTGYDAHMMASLHKAGVYTQGFVSKRVRSGMSIREAIKDVSQNQRYDKGRREGELVCPRLYLYVYGETEDGKIQRRFAQAYTAYDAWCRRHETDSYHPPAHAEAVAAQLALLARSRR